jgi:hypothetical protein
MSELIRILPELDEVEGSFWEEEFCGSALSE